MNKHRFHVIASREERTAKQSRNKQTEKVSNKTVTKNSGLLRSARNDAKCVQNSKSINQ